MEALLRQALNRDHRKRVDDGGRREGTTEYAEYTEKENKGEMIKESVGI
jgi:hypothetical protein